MWILKGFNKSDIEIISEDQQFIKEKRYLAEDLKEIDDGNATFYSIEELENELEKVISKHENSI
jgi:hypothetical protein